jgi:steroid delta-isomerase-like uncharacterized protein
MLDTATRSTTDLDADKTLVRRFISEIFERGQATAVDDLATEDFTTHTGRGPQVGRDALRTTIARVSPALEAVRFTIDDILAEGDRVAVRLTASARQVGEFMGMPPSGKSYTVEEIHWFRVKDGKVAEHWHQFDQVGLMTQLGAMPGQGGTKAGPKG